MIKEEKFPKIYTILAEKKTQLFKPFLKLLTKLRITPNIVSFFGVALAVVYFIFIKTKPLLALALIIIARIMDWFDGALARYQEVKSKKGKLIDMICDETVHLMFILGIAYIGLVDIYLALIFAFASLVFRIILMLRAKRITNYEYIAMILPKTFFYIAAILAVLTQINVLYEITFVLIVFIALHIAKLLVSLKELPKKQKVYK